MSERDAERANTASSSLQVAWLITQLEARRWANARPWHKLRKGKPRSGTARKGAPAQLLLLVVSLVLALNVVNNATRIVHAVAVDAERAAHPGMALLPPEALTWLDEILRHERPTGIVWRSESEQLHELFDFVVRNELTFEREDYRARMRELESVYDSRGRAGFGESQVSHTPWPSTTLWFHGRDPLGMLAPLGAMALLLSFAATLLSIVGTDRDLSRTESTLEWWFTFPVPTRGLLLARLIGSALVSPLLWLLVLPYLWVVFWCAGAGPWLGLPLALLGTAFYGVLAGSLRVAVETTLRAWLPLRRLSQVQAGLELFASVPMTCAIAATSKAGMAFLLEHTRALPGWALLNPFSLPLAWLLPGSSALAPVLLTVLLAGLSVYAALAIGSSMLRDGLSSSSGPLRGSRQVGARPARGSEQPVSLLQTIALQEATSIVRDPGRLVRVGLLPLSFIGIPLLFNPKLLHSVVGSPTHASAAAFFVGALVLASGGLLTLANDGLGVWLFYTVPCALEGVLMRRAVLWSGLAGAFALLTLVALALASGNAGFVLSGHALLALVGVVLYGSIAVALGALGTDVLERERPRRLRPFTAQLFMLLSGMFAFALYTPSPWAKFAQLALSALLSFALWQKLRDHTPYLLDATEAPPPRIAVADGIFAALAFFVLQGLLGLMFNRLGFSPGLCIVFAFAGAGLVVGAGSIYSFARLGVPALSETLGLRAAGAEPLRAVLWGVLTGALGGALAVAYSVALQRIDWLHRIYEETERLDPTPEQLPWLCGLAVFAAPLFEELIFRGILYRGFRRSLHPLYATLASALVFALVHPPLSFVPVFVMAVLAATVFERSRLLLAPIMTHMTYNAIIVGLTLLAKT
ncbi:MAG: hypothetical protein JWN48_1497 [Myxococcaceae bacterium]|nr:hypothetical protein [Myxococcaceae bacterium]